MIKYLGSKRTLAQAIAAGASAIGARTAADLFAGTTRVGQALRTAGIEVVSNDTAAYSEAFGLAYVAAGPGVDRLAHPPAPAPTSQALPPVDGYVTETFCRRSRYFRPENGMRIDAVRDEIDRLDLDPVDARHPAHEPRRSRRPGRLDGRRADGLPEAVGAAGGQRARAARARGRRRAGRPGRPRRRQRRSGRSSTASTWPTSTRRTTSTPISATTTCGRRSCAGTRPTTTASPASASTAGRGRAPTTCARQALAALDRPDRAAPRPGSSSRSRTRASTGRTRSRRCSPARPRRRGRRSAAALRRRPDRHPRPVRPPGRHRLAPREHGAPVRLRPRPAPARSRPRVDFARARSS